MKSKPIYESLLERILGRQGEVEPEGEGEKILTNYVVHQGSRVEERQISEIDWPDNCLLVAIQRGSEELIPKGRTKLQTGDVIVTMTDDRDGVMVQEQMEKLCREMF